MDTTFSLQIFIHHLCSRHHYTVEIHFLPHNWISEKDGKHFEGLSLRVLELWLDSIVFYFQVFDGKHNQRCNPVIFRGI